uniref:Spatacsin_C domain-containing protein n=1 Tax=Macrostomum lignano TaxID=282301 RepID=A0A1I8IPR8_9PLAT
QQQQQQQSSSTAATVSAQQRRPPKHRRRGRSSSRNVASTLTTTESESSADTAAAVPPSRTPPPPNSDADEASTAPDESEIVGGRATAPEAPPRPPGDSDVDGGLLAVVGADSSRRHLGLYARQLGHPLLSLLSERPALSDYLASLAQLPPPTVCGDSNTGVDALLSTPDALIAECRSAGRLDALADACAVFLPQRRGLSELAAACHGISTSVGAEAPAVNERLLESLRAYRDDCPLTGALLRLWDELNAESRTSATATDADDSGKGEEVIGQFKLSARWTSLVGRLKAEEAASNDDADKNLTGEGQQLGGPAAATAAPDGASGLVSSRQRRSVVTLASPQPVTSPSPGGVGGSLESEVTELIDRHAAAASFQQLASVMSSARELTDRLEAAGQFAEMVRLARGIGRYGEMAYVFHKLRSAGHFEPELLCGRGGGVGGRDHRLQRALLEFLRRHCPEDRDSLIAVYLYYCMDRELGNLLFSTWTPPRPTSGPTVPASPGAASASPSWPPCPPDCARAADPRRALAGHPNVYEAAVLAHAEVVRPAGRDWAAAVYGHVIGATATAAGAAAYQSGFMAHVLPTCDTWTGGWRDFEDRLRASCRSSEEKRAAEAFLAACQRSMPAA